MNAVLAATFLGLLTAAPPSGKGAGTGLLTPSIKDEAGMFSPEKRAVAQHVIDEIRDLYRVDLVFQTVAELPGVAAAEWRRMGNTQRGEFLHKTAQDLADAAKCDGLFVLIVREPRHVTVVGWPATRELEISAVKREKVLRKYLARELPHDPDRALIGTCNLFGAIVKDLQPRASAPLGLVPALALVGSLVGLWLLLQIVRGRVVRPALPIYQPAMLGSLFAVPAGYWINDRLFRSERPAAAVAVPAPAPPPAADAPAELDAIDLGERS